MSLSLRRFPDASCHGVVAAIGQRDGLDAGGLHRRDRAARRLAAIDYSESSALFHLHPHGYCYLWLPSLVSTHVIADLLIGLSYVAISATLVYLA